MIQSRGISNLSIQLFFKEIRMSTKTLQAVISKAVANQLLKNLVAAGLTEEIAQSVDNQQALAMMAAILPQREDVVETVQDLPFRFVKTVGVVTVPADYVQETQLATFVAKHGKEFYYLNPALMDKNFAEVTVKLVPGRKLAVDAYQVAPSASSEQCLKLIESKKGLYVGAQGLTLVYQQLRSELPKGRWYLSFDKKVNLPVLDGRRRVPYLFCRSDGDFDANLGYWDGGWRDFYCILVFRDCV